MLEQLRDAAPVVDVDAALAVTRSTLRRRRAARTGAGFGAVLALAGTPLTAVVIARDGHESRLDTQPAPDTTTAVPSTTATTTNPTLIPDVIGLDYRAALTALDTAGVGSQHGFRVLLALDIDTGAAPGVVTRTDPPHGSNAANQLVVFVAAPAPIPNGPEGAPTLDQDGIGAASNIYFPPAGLIPGYMDDTVAACSVPGVAPGRAVRFLNGELVGCFLNMFVWIDQMGTISDPVATMPDVIGLTRREAEERLRDTVGDTPGLGYQGVSDSDDAIVTATNPAPGEPVTRLTTPMLTLEAPSN